MLLDDPIHLRGIAEDFPNLPPGWAILSQMYIDETDEMESETFPLCYFLPDLPGHFPRSDDQDILPRRKTGNVDFEQDAPEKKENGGDQDADIIHLSRNAEPRDGIGKQADSDTYEPDRDPQREEHLPPGLGQAEIVEIEQVHACLTEESDHQRPGDHISHADDRGSGTAVEEEETRHDRQDDNSPLDDETDGASQGEKPVFEGDDQFRLPSLFTAW
jgi:hypothetical protein